jgi:hypothetical protein
MVSCHNVKLECLEHCFHSVPHDRCRMCVAGVCPVTHHRLMCFEFPKPVNVTKNLRKEGKLKNE